MKGIIVYNSDSLIKNRFFADRLQFELNYLGVEMQIVNEDGAKKFSPDFAVMRVYNEELNAYFDKKAIRTFNNSFVSAICNDKWKTYLYLSENGIPVAPTQMAESCDLPFPRVLKSRHGHGGSEVFWTDTLAEYDKTLGNMADGAIAQPVVGKRGRDLRVYVLGGEPIVAMLRKSDVDFRSNFSLGGSAQRYILNKEEEDLVRRIASLFKFDLVGVDFLLSDNGLICNEIEDVVGCRMIYKYTDVDLIKKFAEYIVYSLKGVKTLENI